MNIINKTSEKLVFSIKMEESLANAIRRNVALIPVMAIDEVEISRNDSPLYDETIAHRIGLIPIKMDKSWKEDTILKMKLSIKSEGQALSKEIKGDFEVAYENIPITLLGKDQELKMKGNTRVGIGKEHAKFLPGSVFYRNVTEITMPKEFETEVKKTFPTNDVRVKGDKIIIKDDKEKTITDFCEGIGQAMNKEVLVKNTGELIFTIESFGQMTPKEIFKKALDIFKKELKSIKLK